MAESGDPCLGKAAAATAVDANDHDDGQFHEMHLPQPDWVEPPRPSKRLILCFDGTGNSFKGDTSDTNIVKLYDMLDRNQPHQMHYYQPGIGTYPAEGPVNVGLFGRIHRSFEATMDEALATSFDAHVIAGYRFVMRYYTPGDRIYVFGFSRGAFTARFLSRMISHVGLLSMGNEEMVPFAYKVYQSYEKGDREAQDYMRLFKRSFCRDERAQARGPISHNESGVKVHFLGLFDCVNSVGTLDMPFSQKMPLPKVRGTAEHIRHAVAVDERRVKFKPALFTQEEDADHEDIKEVWFPGNHGDIGGGWKAELAADAQVKKDGLRTKAPARGAKPRDDKTDDPFQLSDITLKWMIDEVDNLEEDHLVWDMETKRDFLQRFHRNRELMIQARMHDTMVFGGGSKWSNVLLWKFMDRLPFIKRWEYMKLTKGETRKVGGDAKSGWKYVALPLNRGARRDIPPDALFHYSVLHRMRLFASYRPRNDVWIVDERRRLDHLDIAHRTPDHQRKTNDLYFVYLPEQTLVSIEELEEEAARLDNAILQREIAAEEAAAEASAAATASTVGPGKDPSRRQKLDRIYCVAVHKETANGERRA